MFASKDVWSRCIHPGWTQHFSPEPEHSGRNPRIYRACQSPPTESGGTALDRNSGSPDHRLTRVLSVFGDEPQLSDALRRAELPLGRNIPGVPETFLINSGSFRYVDTYLPKQRGSRAIDIKPV